MLSIPFHYDFFCIDGNDLVENILSKMVENVFSNGVDITHYGFFDKSVIPEISSLINSAYDKSILAFNSGKNYEFLFANDFKFYKKIYI